MIRVTDKLIEDIVGQVAGQDAATVALQLKDKKDVSEFKIAAYMREDIKVVRNILYRLHNENLVSYKRKKDRRKGWYVSYWTFSKGRVRELVDSLRMKKLEHFRSRLATETMNENNFFMCPRACVRMDFHSSVGVNFKCPECTTVMQQQDNTKTIDFLKEKIREMEAEVGTV